MERTQIDFGIYLGSENCAVAVFNGQQAEMVKNNEGHDLTPSAVYIDKNSILKVGRQAWQRLSLEPDNAHADFLLRIGSDAEYRFNRAGKQMRAEELAAELLKSLRADVKQRLEEDLQAAVITIPAAFELPQCEAVRRAAKLAGIKQCLLILEPTAAAAAYADTKNTERQFWLVYQLKGWSFEVAVVEIYQGEIRVAQYDGDNHLGDKMIDWEIVDSLLAPTAARDHQLSDFVRSNSLWRKAFAKLKQEAEAARLRLIQAETTQIVIDFLCKDANGDPVAFEYELRRSEVVRLVEPLVQRTIDLSLKVLAQAGLDPANLQKAILVGAPALSPFVRDQLNDPQHGLGIPLEYSIDPLTVIAQGAAILASRQPVVLDENVPDEQETCTIALEIETLDKDDTEPIISGQVQAPGEGNPLGYQLEFINSSMQPPWRSGKRTLGQDGSFITALWIIQGQENVISIELSDKSGRRCLVEPDRVVLPAVQSAPPPAEGAKTVRLPAEALEAGAEAAPAEPAQAGQEPVQPAVLPSAKLLEPDLFKTDLVQAITPQPPVTQIELPEPEQPAKTLAATPQAADTVRIGSARPEPVPEPPAPIAPESPLPTPEPDNTEEALLVEQPTPPSEPALPAPPPPPPDTRPLEIEFVRLKERQHSLQERLAHTGSPAMQSLWQAQVNERSWIEAIEEKIALAALGDHLAAAQAANLSGQLSSLLDAFELLYAQEMQDRLASAGHSTALLLQAASAILAERAALLTSLQALIAQGQDQTTSSRLDELQAQIQAGLAEADLNRLESLLPQLIELIAAAESDLCQLKNEILKQTFLVRRTP
ncbi:MAG: Hsp70 family protein [Anaerolineales bacterium]|nr:Hsp70 family protein [Anaerolineales bacterium]